MFIWPPMTPLQRHYVRHVVYCSAMCRVSQGAVQNGLPFGPKNRLLPQHIEAAAYDLLNIDELAELFWASKGVSAAVSHYLRKLRSLFLPSTAFRRFDPKSFGVWLAAKHCRSLTHIAAGAEWSSQLVKETISMLMRLIEHNLSTLKEVSTPDFGAERLFALTHCPRLQRLSIHEDLLAFPAYWLAPPGFTAVPVENLLQRITPNNLPKLCSLEMKWVRSQIVSTILSQGLSDC